MTRIPINKGLRKDIREGIEKRLYTRDEITKLHETVRRLYHDGRTGFKRAAITLGVIFILITMVDVMAVINKQISLPVMLGITGVMALIFLIILIYVRQNSVELNKKQFLRALEEGYPELTERYGEESFQEE